MNRKSAGSVELAWIPPTAQRHHDRVGPGLVEPALDVGLAGQVDFLAADGQDLAIGGRETAHDGCANHATMAGHPDTLAGRGRKLRIPRGPRRKRRNVTARKCRVNAAVASAPRLH